MAVALRGSETGCEGRRGGGITELEQGIMQPKCYLESCCTCVLTLLPLISNFQCRAMSAFCKHHIANCADRTCTRTLFLLTLSPQVPLQKQNLHSTQTLFKSIPSLATVLFHQLLPHPHTTLLRQTDSQHAQLLIISSQSLHLQQPTST